MGRTDLNSNVKLLTALAPEDWGTTKEGLLIDTRGFSGVGVLYLTGAEDANLAVTNKLDVTVHNVADDDEAPSDANKVGAFAQIVAQNKAVPDPIRQQIGIDLGKLDPAKPYLQIKATETNTWEGFIAIAAALGGAQYAPVS
jgi:hypothetical protein